MSRKTGPDDLKARALLQIQKKRSMVKGENAGVGAIKYLDSDDRLNLEVSKVDSIQEFNDYHSIVVRANEVFGNPKKASQWLSRSAADFQGMSPMEEFAKSKSAARVLQVLHQIEHGVEF